MTGTPLPLEIEVPTHVHDAMTRYVAPQGTIHAAQQNTAIHELAGAVRSMGLPEGAWLHADSRNLWPPTKAEYSVWPVSALPETLTLYRGASQRAAKRYAWTPQLDCALTFIKSEWHDEPWRRGATNLRPGLELYIYQVNLTRQQIVDANLIAWRSTSFRGYEELMFADPSALPDPTAVGHIGPRGQYEAFDAGDSSAPDSNTTAPAT
ncbi:hypothetical protein [Microbacterium enclense]|uniref:hypothetical protein n=1 Tax=Microbacterium enclense TaxID=993073 RepID=UPI0034484B69